MRFPELQNITHGIRLNLGIIILGIGLILYLSNGIGEGNYEQLIIVIEIIFFSILALAILKTPYIGVVFTLTSLPLINILPNIPYFSSSVSLVGGITLVSYLLERMNSKQPVFRKFGSGLTWGALFLFWVIVSNPNAALISSSIGRNWSFTYIQLLLLAWLAGSLLDSSRKHHILMWSYSIASVISAIYAFQQGFIGESLVESIRGTGLTEGANSAVRYFIVGLLFLYYLRNNIRKPYLRLLLLICMAFVLLGILATVSRTGLLLVFAAMGMLFIISTGYQNKAQSGSLLVLMLFLIWVYANHIISILQSILPSIQMGYDTVGIRYGLWESGLRMWQDNIISGVGIGNYISNLPIYGQGLLPFNALQLGAHNMYVQILSETGIVGLLLFLAALGVSGLSLYRNINNPNPKISNLIRIWFVVFIVLLIGGITKSDQADKLVWMVLGISISLSGIKDE